MNFDWFEPRLIKGKVEFPLSRASQVIEEMSRIALEEGFTPIFVMQGEEPALLAVRDEDGDYHYGEGLIEFAAPYDFPVIKRS